MKSKVFVKDNDEEILVVERNKLFVEGIFEGLKPVDMSLYEQRALSSGTFIWRSDAETNVLYKQIIPYLVFTHENRYFLMQRKSSASEVRLRNKFSLGIGGHIRREDISSSSFVEWAHREFDEEVCYDGSFLIEPIGLINDESTLVGQVHTGFVFLLRGDSPNISIRSELKSGVLATLDECETLYENLETWSAWVADYLKIYTAKKR